MSKKNIVLVLFALIIGAVLTVSCSDQKKDYPADFDGLPKPGEVLAEFKADPENIGALRGQESLRVRLQATVKPGWKIYPLVDQGESLPAPTTLDFTAPHLIPFNEPYETKPNAEYLELFDLTVQTHKKSAVFYQNFTVDAAHPVGDFNPSVKVTYVACSFKVCMPPADQTVPFSYSVLPGEPRSDFMKQDLSIENLDIGETENYRSEGLFSFILLAMLMGLISLATPCVFPMIPITVGYFTKKSENNRKETLKYAVLFALGIIGSYTGLGLLLSLIFGAQAAALLASNPWVNLFLGGLFIVFSLSLIGVINLQLPSGLVTSANKLTGLKGKYTGIMAMGIIFALTAFTCTVQFIGILMVAAYRGDILWPLLGMIFFSTVFAFPFFLFAILPGMIGKVRAIPGDMLRNVKIVLGILELAMAAKFFSNTDMVLGTFFISRDANLIIWVLLCLACLVFLLYCDGKKRNLFRLSLSKIPIALFILLAGYFASGLGDNSVGPLADSILPPPKNGFVKKGDDFVSEEVFASLNWHGILQPALEEAQQNNKNIFIDFTGYTCINCRWMEQNVFAREEVFSKLKTQYVIAKLYTDGGEYAAENRRLQADEFNAVSLPFYVITDKYGNALRSLSGIVETDTFERFLRE